MITTLDCKELIDTFLEKKDDCDITVIIKQNEWLRITEHVGLQREFLITDNHPKYKELYENSNGFELPVKLENAKGDAVYEINLSNFPKEWTVEQLLNHLNNQN